MIGWHTAARTLDRLTGRPGRTAAALDGAVAAAPPFRNTDYPVSPLPLFVRHDAATALVPRLERYVALLSTIVRHYREQPELRRWYGLGAAAESLITADRRLGDAVPVCRLDGYLERGTETPTLLENNADAPAGTLFTARVNGLVADALERAGLPVPATMPLTLTAPNALLDVLVGALERAGLPAGDPRVAILQLAGRSNRESHEMAASFAAAGVRAVVADPRELRVAAGRVWFGAERVNVCWNKVNTVAWRDAVESDPALVDRWVAALWHTDFVHVNPFGARYVAESKLSLALPSDPRLGALFTAGERELAAGLLPWACRASKEALAPDGRTPLVDELAEHPADYVLKEPYDIRGDGVTIGRATARSEWERAVARAVEDGRTVQRYVPPTAYPVLRPGGVPAVLPMPVSLDAFVFHGRVCGFGSKASLHPRLNVFQGGQKLAALVVDEPDGAAA